MSPAMAAAAAIKGHFTDIREWKYDTSDEPAMQIDSSGPEDQELQDAVYEHEKQPLESSSSLEDDRINDIPQEHEASLTVDEAATTDAPAGMDKFTVLSSITAPLDKANVDTDAIIPKQFLKTIKRTGLSKGLFYELRFIKDDQGKDVETDFVLNVEPYRQAEILLVTGDNFGCGSSREHAPWALKDFGIKCMIAPSFGDIFYNNSCKNGLLPIRLPQEVIKDKLYPLAVAGKKLTIDLPNQQILNGETNEVLVDHFDIEEFRKHCLVNGLDDIGLTLQKEEYIRKYEEKRRDKFSFLEGGSKRITPIKGAKKSKYGLKTQEW